MSIVVARIYLGWEHAGTQGWRDIDIYLLHGGTWHSLSNCIYFKCIVLDCRNAEQCVLVIFLLTIMTWRKCYVGWSIRIGQRAYTSNGGRILWSGTSSPRKQSKHLEEFAVTCIVCCLLASFLNWFSMQICSRGSGRPVSNVHPWKRERERSFVLVL